MDVPHSAGCPPTAASQGSSMWTLLSAASTPSPLITGLPLSLPKYEISSSDALRMEARSKCYKYFYALKGDISPPQPESSSLLLTSILMEELNHFQLLNFGQEARQKAFRQRTRGMVGNAGFFICCPPRMPLRSFLEGGFMVLRAGSLGLISTHLPGRPREPAGMETSRGQDGVTPLVDIPAPPAPFDHRIVTAKQGAVNSFYTVSKTEILGGGRFGQVHKCEETATGLKLAAKIIKTRGMKDKEEVKNEISVMNQLDHANLIQLYDAFESKDDIVLVMEYVDGGELFDRIIDENYNLTELDTILFMKQICEGIRHMHQMYILHLDLKPENILCVNRDAKQIKIIDFGLARRYKPREKLKVNFGTPEFLAPEVVNYDFVSFPTDMWSVGVIAYMLLSGLSPFLGDNDAETLNNILACRWDLEDEEFQDISEEAKEFISKLLIKEKSWRISASEALKHPWLSDHKLHSRLNAQKKKNRGSDAQDFVTK
ncbi:hypothetical protein H8959_010411 [Pygathrix nigripes]